MSIIKIKKRQNYTVINNDAIKDNSLSWQAKGLLIYLMSLPENWKVRKTELHKHAKNGRDSTSNAFNELQNSGYILQEKEKGGKFGFIYTVSDFPLLKTRNGKTDTENPPLISKDILNSNEFNKESKEGKAEKKAAPSFDDVLKINFKFTNQDEKEKEKSPAKKEKRPHVFPDNTARKSYKVTPPPNFEASKKPYEMFLNNYPFEAKGWTKEIIKEFLVYCEVRAEGRKFSTAQMKLRLTEINEALKNQNHNDIIMILKLAQNGKNGGWASFEFDERIKDRLKQKNKNKDKHDITASYDKVKSQLDDPNFLFNFNN